MSTNNICYNISTTLSPHIYSDDNYTVVDYCARNFIQMVDAAELVIASSYKNLLMLTILENHEAKTIEMVNFEFIFSNSLSHIRRAFLMFVLILTAVELRFRVFEKTLDRSDVASHQFQSR